MEAEDASWESTARSPNSFFKRASCRAVQVSSVIILGAERQTLYVFGSWGMRFKMRVVFPLPRKPVIIVTGVGVMLAADGFFGQLSEECPTLLCKVSLAGEGAGRDDGQLPHVQALANIPGKFKYNATGQKEAN